MDEAEPRPSACPRCGALNGTEWAGCWQCQAPLGGEPDGPGSADEAFAPMWYLGPGPSPSRTAAPPRREPSSLQPLIGVVLIFGMAPLLAYSPLAALAVAGLGGPALLAVPAVRRRRGFLWALGAVGAAVATVVVGEVVRDLIRREFR